MKKKYCSDCKKMLLVSSFGKIKGVKKVWYKGHCRECSNKRCIQWRKKNPIKIRLCSMKTVAKQRGHLWNIPDSTCWALMASPCAYCGQIQETFNGLDRINSDKDYSINNVVPCCTRCNRAKCDMSVEEFMNHIEKIYKYKR